jgi:uncharacterized protein YecT (DUF1311 family)
MANQNPDRKPLGLRHLHPHRWTLALFILGLLSCGGGQTDSLGSNPGAGSEASGEASSGTSGEANGTVAVSQPSVVAVPASVPGGVVVINSQGWQVSATGVGPIQMGMTLGALKQILGPEFSLVPEPDFMVDWGAIALLEAGQPLLYILHPADLPPMDQDPIDLLWTNDPKLTTPEGIGPGSLIWDAVAVYGEPTLSYNLENEMREYVWFAGGPSDISFRTEGEPEAFVGIYDQSEGSYYETQEFDDTGAIASLLIDGYGRRSVVEDTQVAETVVAETDPVTSEPPALDVDCTNPQITPEINFCSQEAYNEADANLNQVYQTVLNPLSGREQEQLTDTQLAWLAFRDAHCGAVTEPMVGGTGYLAFLNGCLTELTEIRIGQLQQDQAELPPSDQRSSGIGRVSVNGQEIDCDNPLGTPVINYCAGLAYEQADTALDQTYQQFATTWEGSGDQLRNAQGTWIGFRDRHCEFATRTALGGTGYEAYRSNCLEDLTRDRTQQLVDWMNF